jgi:micrococcal nuclease
MRVVIAVLFFVLGVMLIAPSTVAQNNCSPAYPDICLPPAPDLDCKDIPEKNFRVLPPDPHKLDRDDDGIGCEA